MKIYQNLEFHQEYYDDLYKINFIIPVRGRIEFGDPLLRSVFDAINNTKEKIQVTIFEHSENPEHKSLCKFYKINYFYLKSSPDEVFNKCLCYNGSFLFTQPSDWYVFHDLDCIIQKDFFNNLLKNIEKNNLQCIHSFTKRRVLYLNSDLSKKIINKELTFESLTKQKEGIFTPKDKCQGGSITINRELFFRIGGFDPEFFHGYSIEDFFVWEKLETLIKNIKSCDSPPNEIYHLYHQPIFNNNEIFKFGQELGVKYLNLPYEEKLIFIDFLEESLRKYFNEFKKIKPYIKKDLIKPLISKEKEKPISISNVEIKTQTEQNRYQNLSGWRKNKLKKK